MKGCGNGSYRLNKWKNESKKCDSEPPFKLFPFPTLKKDPEKRNIWISNINRLEEGSKLKLFTPSKDMRVCSNHFKDGAPTTTNPNPTEKLGYDFDSKLRRRSLNTLQPTPSTSTSRGSKRRRSFDNTTVASNPTDFNLTDIIPDTVDIAPENNISDCFYISVTKNEGAKNRISVFVMLS